MLHLNRRKPVNRFGSPLAGLVATVLASAGAAAAPAAGAPPDSIAMAAEIQALRAEQQRITELQQQIEMKLQKLEASLHQDTAPAGQPGSRAAPALVATLSPAAAKPRLAVSGDLRLRTQGDYSDRARDRLSGQLRGRLGATYAASDHLTIGARLVTGDPDDPNSTDVQLSNFDDDLQVSLDQAYMQLNLGELKIYGGKMPQPFTRTDLVWDGDVNPQGLGAVYRHALADGAAFRANGLFFIVDESAASDSTMLGAQFGYDTRALGNWKVDASAAYYDYTLGSTTGGDSGDFRSNPRNPNGTYVSGFRLGDLIVGASWNGAGDRWPLRLVGDYVHNFDAATDTDTGYGADLIVGRTSKAHDWRVTYGYSVAETDAVLAAFSHDNIALGTNYRLHALTLDYVPFPKTMLSAYWYHYRPHDVAPSLSSDWIDRVRIAFAVSF